MGQSVYAASALALNNWHLLRRLQKFRILGRIPWKQAFES